MDLNLYLKESGKLKKKFAEEAGITYVTLWNIATGRVIPTLKTAFAIQKASNGKVTIHDLLKNLSKNYDQKNKVFDIEVVL